MGHKIKKVFDLSLTKFPKCKISKLCSRRVYIGKKFRIFVDEDLATFQCSISKKNNRPDIEKFFKTTFINNHGFYRLIFLQITGKYLTINFHSAGVDHGAKETIAVKQGADTCS